MTTYHRISLTVSTINAVIVALMSWAFHGPAITLGVAVWVLTFVMCWLAFGLCSAAGTTDRAIESASRSMSNDGD